MDQIIDFVKKEKFDIVQLQEVSGGAASNGGVSLYPPGMTATIESPNQRAKGAYLFEELKENLGMNGELIATHKIIDDPTSYMGNATFFNNKFSLIEKHIVWLSDFKEVSREFSDIPTLGRAALVLKLSDGKKDFCIINTHLAWGPTPHDEKYKIVQAKKLVNYLETLDLPFVLTGDFNVIPETKTVSLFNGIGRNLTVENGIKNTLNPRTHPVKHLFPKGLAVDYVIIDQNIKLNEFRVVDSLDLSDHFGLIVEIEI